MAAGERALTTRAARAWLPLAAAAACVGAGTWLILDGRTAWGGAAAAAAGLLSIGGAILARGGAALGRMVDSLVDRAFDGCLFSAIAWVARGSDETTSAGALIALSAGFLGAYVRARGESLGYRVEESLVTRALRYTVVSAGLMGGWLRGGVLAAAAVSMLASAVRASQVAKEERA